MGFWDSVLALAGKAHDLLALSSRNREGAKCQVFAALYFSVCFLWVKAFKGSIKMEMLSSRSNALSHYLSLTLG